MMIGNRSRISRRTFLRGALAGGGLATIPLPRLDAMLNGHGTAYASGLPLQRFGVYFIGNGFVPVAFLPPPIMTAPLDAATLTRQLKPFAPVLNKVTVASGFDLHTGRQVGVPHGHFFGALSGVAATGRSRQFQLPTIDMVIKDSKSPLGKTTFKSLQLGVSQATPGVGDATYHAVSGYPNNPNTVDFNPQAVFDRMFKGLVPPHAPASMGSDPTRDLEVSVLDAVRQDAQELQARLGRDDRARLDFHLTSIGALEEQLRGQGQAGVGADLSCAIPTVGPTGGGSSDGLDAKLARVQSDLLVMALACDLTRIFTFQLTMPAAHVHYNVTPALSTDFHDDLCHGDSPDSQPRVQEGSAYALGFMSDLLQKMDAVKEGDGTLLDNSIVLVSTCVSWGKTHTQYEWPCVIGGRGGRNADGKYNLQGGWHYRSSPTGANFSRVLITLANMVGAGLTELGKEGGHVTDAEQVAGLRGPGF
jgi:uncharacterized protein DUF1552